LTVCHPPTDNARMASAVPSTALPRRRWQFSLRTFLLFMLIVAVPLAWLGSHIQERREQEQILSELSAETYFVCWMKMDGGIYHVESREQRSFSVSLFDHPVALDLNNGFNPPPNVITQKAVRLVSGLRHLKRLSIRESPIEPAAIRLLASMDTLEELDLSHTDINDDGLTHLRGLRNLRFLELSGTQVSDEGVRALQEALPDLAILDD
jgi:hypothetical protein